MEKRREREVEGEEKEELETSFFAARDFRLSHKQPSRHPLSGEKCRHHPLESTPILLYVIRKFVARIRKD